MRSMGLKGIRRAKTPHTTRSAPREQCPADLADRHFSAFQPNELRVADITYARTFSGWVYVAFVTDVSSRRIVGWQTSTSLYTDQGQRRSRRPRPPLRPRSPVPLHPLWAGPGRLPGGSLGGVQGRLLRQRPGGSPELLVQGRAHPQQGPLDVHRRCRARHRRVGPAGTTPCDLTPRSGCSPPVEHEHAHHAGTGAEVEGLDAVDRPLPETTTTRQTSLHKTRGLTFT